MPILVLSTCRLANCPSSLTPPGRFGSSKMDTVLAYFGGSTFCSQKPSTDAAECHAKQQRPATQQAENKSANVEAARLRMKGDCRCHLIPDVVKGDECTGATVFRWRLAGGSIGVFIKQSQPNGPENNPGIESD